MVPWQPGQEASHQGDEMMSTVSQTNVSPKAFDQPLNWNFLFEQDAGASTEPTRTDLVNASATKTKRNSPVSKMLEHKFSQCYAGAVGAFAVVLAFGVVDFSHATAFLAGSTAMFTSSLTIQKK